MSILDRGANAFAVLAALSKSQAIIEFDLSGKILTANENFCRALGYELSEIVGRHHSMFVEPSVVSSQDYKAFWSKLSAGQFDQRQYKRIGKGGREVWIEASYNPVSRRGKPVKVVKIATDITDRKLKAAEDAGKIDALSRAQAIIEFSPDGEVLTANENFLAALGYSLAEVQGRHHSMFCEPAYTQSPQYKQFWERLAGGDLVADEFMRLGKGGRKVFIQASYNPIFDLNGKVFKVVKFATDVTGRVENVEKLAQCLTDLAEGDLAQSIDKPFIPSLERLRTDFNAASEKLKRAMTLVSENAGAISSGSNEIRSAADDLARRTEQQAASIEETAAALEEITTAVNDSSRRAEEAGKIVARARDHAEHSGQVVRDAIGAMDQIEKSSREISNIIGVIDEIAFQTNLLALNAGVEAARAGEAGKGFAVVAQEVRELAQRSATAAKEIKSLINASGTQVENGVGLVTRAGSALQEIAEQVRDINTNVVAIVDAAREQSTALAEINQAVNTVDQGTQQNAAMVEEQTAASHSLAREATALFELLGQFRFDDATRYTASPRGGFEQQPVPASPRRGASRPLAARGSAAVAVNHEEWQDF
ncbi:methyl-accepting chemotaxis protein [Agrobacterium radiobacter]|uniref:Methyl-accepting chemotaxis serine transducer n=1 Tax=Agrobacterium tumefaciens str. Kerr 14 TaxID=1183424 RepID=A0A1S7R0C1_AGRTU|nr:MULTISPECIES: PAS domain-containing methyl-accepting chemotaxis protein [Agrobacterium]AYM82893.1 methyl-accepting chemotaxis protein [Agrobacterium tumefaciens]MDP9789178.1 methyl-accepting chemotaxis protein [Agrobacterium tumefaciens]MDP9855477.1 methyl-accepting chemotaxis protein [Agrobacterium tumefaciens]MDP9875343.1 methyl-accepting chemotaxis protein [Agrobacterium tumefaciens]MDP9980269.1 methyl-accepting chemotaxis protein [Agrobacterium tumefaciens]